ncbi:DUF6114 domain-containing protein [Streptomyces sp. NPDC046887]|uniref:DUF6114 domain-containing protein n=1 Tax=Streptomyces sp. NPDC046887 TaxID=3155472 RepID=UPI0033C801A2
MLLTSRTRPTPPIPPPRSLADRPRGATLLVLAAAAEIAYFPLGEPSYLSLQGQGGALALAVAACLAGCGVHMWCTPARAARSGWAAIVIGLMSYPFANMGGFLVGMVLALVGGSLAVARRPTPAPSPAPAAGP